MILKNEHDNYIPLILFNIIEVNNTFSQIKLHIIGEPISIANISSRKL